MAKKNQNTKIPWGTRLTLLEKIRDQHDNCAWADFVHYYRQYVYSIIRRMNVQHHDAEEIVQNVMLKSWKKLPEFEYSSAKGRFRGWLCMVTGNEVKSWFRKHRGKETVSLSDEENNFEVLIPPEIEKIAEEEWREYLPRLAWKNIKEHFENNARKCYLLTLEGVSVKEISEKLGIATSTVYVHKKRIVDRIQEEVSRLNLEL